MPTGLIRIVRNYSLIALVLGTLSASAADVGQSVTDDQSPPKRLRPTQVHFADGSAMPADEGPGILTAVPPATPTPAPRQSANPDGLNAAEPGALPPPPAPPSMGSATAEKSENTNSGAPLVPVPDSKYLGPAEIEVTSFHGITPAVSTRADVEKTWGKPKDSRKLETGLMQLYSVDPFPRVEVAYSGNNKVASLVIRFERGFPSAQVAEQLELTKVQPVLVSNELGEVLGQSYPERGVLFSFEPATDPSKALKKVTHIVLEPITAEPFVLRAETNIDIRPEFSLHDSEQAIKLQPGNARRIGCGAGPCLRWASRNRPWWRRPRRCESSPAMPATRLPRPRPCNMRAVLLKPPWKRRRRLP